MALRDVAPGLPDHEHQFTLVIELRRRARTHKRRVVPDQGTWRAHEHARVFRRVLAVFILGVTVRIVHADADDLFRRRDRRLPNDRIERMIRRTPRSIFGKFCKRAGGDRFAQRRILLPEARGKIDDAGIGHRAVSGSAADRVSREARRGHEKSLSARRHAGGFDDGGGGRRPEVVDQRSCRAGFPGVGSDR
jgi:hypothetical protein